MFRYNIIHFKYSHRVKNMFYACFNELKVLSCAHILDVLINIDGSGENI
jgi:hypothetical protein